MKHEAIIIGITDLVGRICQDSDNFDLQDALDIDDREELPGRGCVLVTWPEHVINPRYNADANYCHFDEESEAQSYEPEAAIYE